MNPSEEYEYDQICEYIQVWGEEWTEKIDDEFEIMGYDLGANIVSTIIEAIHNSKGHKAGETNKLTREIIRQMQTYHLQDDFDFSESGKHYYSVIVPSVYKLSAHFLIRPLIKKAMTDELNSAIRHSAVDLNADEIIGLNSNQIDQATDDMFNAYLLDCDLDAIYTAEQDWFREYLYTPEIVFKGFKNE